MQVHCDEGLANHIGPMPCVDRPRGRARSVGRGKYRPAIEPRKLRSECRRRLTCGRRHDRMRHRELRSALRGLRPWHVHKLLVREPGDLVIDRLHLHRSSSGRR